MTQKQTLIKEATALNINVPKKVTIAQLESMIADAKQPAPNASPYSAPKKLPPKPLLTRKSAKPKPSPRASVKTK